jgi:hypothetical protein
MKTQYWRISPGEKGYLWREQKLNECIAIGWSKIGNVAGVGQEGIRRRCAIWKWSKRDADRLFEFANEFQIGDKVVVSTSGRGIFALGTVVGDYEYNKNLEYKHSRKVRWDTTFWHPVEIERLGLPPGADLYNKFHGTSSGVFRSLSEEEWDEVYERLNGIQTPFRNLQMWGGLIQSPEYENEVIILFSQMLQHLHMRIAGFGTRFPDAIIERKERRKWKRLNVEFELWSSGFQAHLSQCEKRHCDAIVCWEDDDWREPKRKQDFEIIELKKVMAQIL